MNFSLQTLRRSAAELLACAVTDLFPEAQIIEGEGTETGFYYDFYLAQPIDDQAVSFIEERMRALVKEQVPIRAIEMMRENAATLFTHRGQEIKAEIISTAPSNIVPIIQIGDFFDYCLPPYVSNTADMSAFKLTHVETLSYSLFNQEEIPVTRIEGIASEDKYSLKKALKTLEVKKNYDHRILGKEMNLFRNDDNGGWQWLPKGALLKESLIEWWRREHLQQGCQILISPSLIKSGVVKGTKETIPSFPVEGIEFTLRISFLHFHALAFKSQHYTDKDLPIRFAECAEIYTNKKNSQLRGLLHSRAFFNDSTHIFCTADQVIEELISSLQFIDKIFKILGFEYHWYLGQPLQKKGSSQASWDKATAWIVKALETCGFKYAMNQIENVRSGPFVEAYFIDSLGREWQGPEVSVDLNSPEQFALSYQKIGGKSYPPVMLTRSLFRSLERFIAILIEHYRGIFPLWLAPEQVRLIPVTEQNIPAAEKIGSSMKQSGLKVSFDYHEDSLGSKIHRAESERVPYMVIIGEKEEKTNTITVRSLCKKEIKAPMELSHFLTLVQEEIQIQALPTYRI